MKKKIKLNFNIKLIYVNIKVNEFGINRYDNWS
jgi:hypothetical protein